ncbi:LPXTG cell wall anchor domain-containing protein [Paenibacillus sp. FSL R7-0297]|uniref:LPXTG cell wall anchor domain-containing protein n=1 Tax=Paenibacillus sp. FSL R7-0297 TaxID=2921680 RepID=UPI00404083AC
MPTPTPIIGYIVNPDTIIIDDPLPLGPVTTVTPRPLVVTPSPTLTPSPSATPSPTPIVTIIDEEIPLGNVPADASLPKTGESSPAPYYLVGLALAGLGIFLGRRSRTDKRK